MELTCLGSGDAYSYQRQHNTYLIEDSILLDCGTDILNSLESTGKKTDSIETVFISHPHGDHFMGLPYVFNKFIRDERDKDLTIVGPEGIKDKVERLYELTYPDNSAKEVDFAINFLEVEPRSSYQLNSLSFETYPMNHSNEFMTAVGYKLDFEQDDKKLAYTGDTGFTEELFKLGKGTDMMIIDCNFYQMEFENHLNFKQIKEIRQEIKNDTELLLTHLSEVEPEMRQISGVTVAEDLKEYSF